LQDTLVPRVGFCSGFPKPDGQLLPLPVHPGGCSWRSMRCCQPSRSAAALITSRATITTAREPQEPDSRPPTGCCPPRQSLVRGRCCPIARPAASVINTTSPRVHDSMSVSPAPVLPACLLLLPRRSKPCQPSARPHPARPFCLLRAQYSAPPFASRHHFSPLSLSIPHYTALLFSSRCQVASILFPLSDNPTGACWD
jgi:hypothetical protein